MTSLSEINLHTTGNTILLIVSILLAIALSYFVYRNTIPPVSTGWRVLLSSLRTLSIILIILLLFEPILSITRKKQEKPLVAVLMDNSASMSLLDEKVNRPEEMKKVLNTGLFQDPPGDYELTYFQYSHSLSGQLPLPPDSLDLGGDGTDIQRALEELKEALAEKYFSSVILITDGADNLGENPARYASIYGVPIYAVAIGDPSEQKDVLITNYATNEIAYAGTRIPVDVYTKSSGFEGRRIPVNLVHENKTVDTKMVQLSGSGFEQKVRLHFVPESEGLFKYEINLPKLEGELTQINNSKSFYTKVLKSKLKVLVISGGPSADLLFLKRTLMSDENIDVQSYVEKQKGRFYQSVSLPASEQLEKFDCFILLDYPRRSSSRQSLDKLKGVLAKGKPVLYLVGRNLDFEKLWALKDFIPLETKPIKTRERSVYLKISPRGIHHPILRLSEDDLENRESWQELPPVFTNLRSMQLRTSAQTLASVDLDRSPTVQSRSLPLLAVYISGKRKSAAMFAYGLWRWDLLMWGVGKSNQNYQRFLRNTVRWLTTMDDSKLVKITSNKEIYRSGEQVQFTAQVYFEDYQPVDGAEVAVQLTGGKDTQELTLSNIGDGRYEGSFQVLEGGDYQFSGTAHQQGRVLGRDSGKFSVEEFSLEYQNTRMNQELLKRIANESGGEYYTSSDFSGLGEKLNFPEKYITLKNEWEIWNRTPLLIICVFLLSAEWLIRKRNGML